MKAVHADEKVLNILPGEAGSGVFLLSYLSDMRKDLNLVVTASGQIVMARPVRARNGKNLIPVNFSQLGKGVFEVSLLDIDRSLSSKVRIS